MRMKKIWNFLKRRRRAIPKNRFHLEEVFTTDDRDSYIKDDEMPNQLFSKFKKIFYIYFFDNKYFGFLNYVLVFDFISSSWRNFLIIIDLEFRWLFLHAIIPEWQKNDLRFK